MVYRKSLLLQIAALILALSATGQDAALPPASVVQQQLQNWVKTRQLISQEKSDWEAEKATLSELNMIRKAETAQLGEFIGAAGKRIEEISEQRKAFSEEETELKSWRRDLGATIARLEKEIRPHLVRFPPPLREQVEDSVLRLESSDSERPLQQRTRDLLLVLQAFLDFQNSITLDGDVREVEGERREIDILYLGFTQAWFADESGKFGGYGRATDSGWAWTTDSSIAARVRKTIDIQQKQLPPEFISLPLQTEAEGKN